MSLSDCVAGNHVMKSGLQNKIVTNLWSFYFRWVWDHGHGSDMIGDSFMNFLYNESIKALIQYQDVILPV